MAHSANSDTVGDANSSAWCISSSSKAVQKTNNRGTESANSGQSGRSRTRIKGNAMFASRRRMAKIEQLVVWISDMGKDRNSKSTLHFKQCGERSCFLDREPGAATGSNNRSETAAQNTQLLCQCMFNVN